MSNCGKCKGNLCSCHFIGDGSTTAVYGIGSVSNPFRVSPLNPAYKPVGSARANVVQSIPLGSDTALNFHYEDLLNTPTMFNPLLPTRLTAPIAGLYMMGGYVTQGGGVGAQVLHIWIARNGAITIPLVKRTVNNNDGMDYLACDVMTLFRLAANDYIELYARSNRTANTASTINSIETFPHLWANWMGV